MKKASAIRKVTISMIVGLAGLIYGQSATYPNGSVTIGTSNPLSYKLRIVSAGSIGNLMEMANFSNDANTYNLIRFTRSMGSTELNSTGGINYLPTVKDGRLGGIVSRGVALSKGVVDATRIFMVQDGDAGTSFIPGRIEFWTGTKTAAPVERMRINNNGNVYIGTPGMATLPAGYKLAVNGNILATEIRVETNWSDFVFEKNYNLKSISEVESFIKEKGHLPDIPSAKEVENNGIALGEMNAKLLQKIEELTLYVIEQDKRLRKMEQK